MKCTEEEKEERLKAQKEAQQRMEEKKQQGREKQKVKGVLTRSMVSCCPLHCQCTTNKNSCA